MRNCVVLAEVVTGTGRDSINAKRTRRVFLKGKHGGEYSQRVFPGKEFQQMKIIRIGLLGWWLVSLNLESGRIDRQMGPFERITECGNMAKWLASRYNEHSVWCTWYKD